MDKNQAEAKEQIALMMRKKDYYDILGLPKSANETQIKKAYKKLALKFHPDKNSYEGAKDVFKKVSNAYSVLVNPEQKERYDRFGPEDEQVRQRPQYHTHQRHTGDEQFDEFDQIFKAFFGMNGMHMNRRGGGGFRYTYQTGAAQAGGNNNYANAQRNQGFGVHYLFIFVFLFYALSPLFKSAPYYSLSVDSTYKFRVNTNILNTQYYVREEFFNEVKKDPRFKGTVDLEVDEQYLVTLRKTCEQANRLKKTYEYRAYQYTGDYRSHYLGEANKVDMGSCKKIDQLYAKHPDYVSQLYYYR